MSNQIKHRWRKDQLLILGILSLVFLVCTVILNWIIGLVGLVILAFVIFWILRSDVKFEKKLEKYITTLSHRVKKVGDEALLEMPIGIILYDERYNIEWMNTYMISLTGGNSFLAHSINHISEALIPIITGDEEEAVAKINKRRYRVVPKREERLLYLFDVTPFLETKERYSNEQTVFAIIYLDNYDEVTQGMEDQLKSNLNNKMTAIIKDWALEKEIYLKRFSSEKFFAVLDQSKLKDLEKGKFSILDDVRESTSKSHIPLTLSVGIGANTTSLLELGQLAQSALDLALGRGGDQVVIKHPDGKVRFFGGKSNPIEKRTRVRARVISHALSELIIESDQVMVMGHQLPDMDAIGAGIGIMEIAEANEKHASIVVEPENYGSGVIKLIEEIQEREELWSKFISTEEAIDQTTEKTLVVVVDTHKPSMVMEPKLLTKADRVVVMDHHRRGEEFIKDPVLVYMEPYASSTSELVTELLEYQPKKLKLGVIEATSMLAGITVDTKSFTLRTGARTFDAASYLRANGADTILVQKLLREDLDHFNRRAKLIQNTELYRGDIAIAVGDKDMTCDQVLIAQAADTLLSMENIRASFVISVLKDEKIGISARSLGEINVQLVMESIGGGGHLTNAATQLNDMTIEEAKDKLKEVIDEYLEGGE
ncbi:c-di-AMP phosphodiesterase-like protein [Scopulibacillus darangshiensis]|uniref:Cyclic-di-AMP phosphodiesterase n=1 Tax=Scopulibacillus darangshiensis TaxID=442528 RepID=A0A4R2NFF5_9BACL|nr:DHH family phosphoesterase [Scopulibacillus darangshiensis]TCP20031.1 c-di-AMP phosphodiesterase-like protein [Scopulibacillus darangshiensis]